MLEMCPMNRYQIAEMEEKEFKKLHDLVVNEGSYRYLCSWDDIGILNANERGLVEEGETLEATKLFHQRTQCTLQEAKNAILLYKRHSC